MRRLFALLMGVAAGVVTLRLIRRRMWSRSAARVTDTPTKGDAGRASELRRKLDEARERTAETVGPATPAGESTPAAAEPDVEPEEEPAAETAAATETTELADRRKRVHGRAREAAESMRDGNDTGTA